VLTASNVDWEGQVNEVLDMVGMMMWATGSQQPTGRWIQPAGFTLSRATYPELWAYAQSSGNLAVQASKLPHQYGDGDGSTTFSIPDLRGEFLRVWDDGRGVDSGRVFGTSQTDAVQAFSGSITSTGEDDAGVYNVKTSGGPFRTGGATRRRFESSPNNTNTCSNTLTFNNAWSQRTASETRPRNIALMLWLRY
jgi:phage-related tail fiber protein